MPSAEQNFERPWRILLVGSGGVGTMASYALETGGEAEVTSVLRSTYDMVMKQGFSIDSVDHGRDIHGFRPSHITRTVPDMSTSDSKPFDYIIVATKNIPDIPPTVSDLIAPAVTPGVTSIVLLQNGLNIELPLVERFPTNIILSGVSLIGAAEIDGSIKHDEPDFTRLGVFPNQTVDPEVAKASALHLIDAYNAGGKVEWIFDEDVSFSRWRKLLYNASYNVVAALTGIDVIRMRMSQFMIDDLIYPLIREIRAIAMAAGVVLPKDLELFFIKCDTHEGFFMPSMGQDCRKGNAMEIDNIVGAPLREADRLGVPVPTLRTCYHLLRSLQLKVKENKGLWTARFEAKNPYA
ncbi:6-phosphogluconate dehydrogenase C-terminal domain-like protein, partial [Aureobasidium melanogenum]